MSFTGYLILTTILLLVLAQATANRTISLIAWTLISIEVIFTFLKSR